MLCHVILVHGFVITITTFKFRNHFGGMHFDLMVFLFIVFSRPIRGVCSPELLRENSVRTQCEGKLTLMVNGLRSLDRTEAAKVSGI